MSADGSLNFDTSIQTSGFESGVKTLGKIGKTAIGTVGKSIAGVSAGLVALGKQAADIGTAYGDSLNKVATIADTSVKSIAEISASVKKLSLDTGTSSSELNEALYQAISAGADTAKAVDLVEVAVKSAKGGFTDTATAVDGLTSVLNTYGMATEEAGSLANKFLVTQNLGKTSFGELAASIGSVAPTAASTGVSIDNLLSSVAALTANGIGTSEAMTGLKAALSNVIAPTAEAEKAAKEMGIEFSAAALQSKGWDRFLQEIAEATDGDSAQMSRLFGSVEALNSMLILTGNGAELFNKSLNEMAVNTTALDDAYEKMTDSLTTDMEKLKAAAEILGTSFYDSISLPLRELVKVGTGYITELSEALEQGGLEAVSAKIGAILADAVNTVGSYVPQIAQAAADIINGFIGGIGENSSDILIAASDIIDVLISAVNNTVPMFTRTAAEIIIKIATEIISHAGELTRSAVEIIIALADGISAALPELVPAAADAVIKIADTVIDNVDELGDAAAEIINSLSDSLINAENLKKLIENVPVLVSKLVFALGDLAEDFLEVGAKFIDNISSGMENVDFKTEFKGVYDRLYNVGIDMHRALIDGYNEDNLETAKRVYAKEYEEWSKMSKAELADTANEIMTARNKAYNALYYLNHGSSEEDVLSLGFISEEDIEKAKKNGQDLNMYLAQQADDLDKQYNIIWDITEKGDKEQSGSLTGGIFDPETIETAGAEVSEEFAEFYDKLRAARNEGLIEEDEYKNKLREKLNSSGKYLSGAYTSYWNEVAAAPARSNNILKETGETAENTGDSLTELAGIADGVSDEFDKFYKNLRLDLAMGKITDDQYKSRLSEKLHSDSAYAQTAYTSYWNEIKDTTEKSTGTIEEEMRTAWSEIEHLNALGVDSDEITQKKRLAFIQKYCPEYSDEWYDYYKTVYDYQKDCESDSLNSTKETLSEQADIVKEKLSEIAENYKSKYADIQNSISSYKNNLLSVGETFSVEENTDENGVTTKTFKVNDIAKRLAAMKEYHASLLKLRDMGASSSLLKEIMSLGAENGAYMASELVNDPNFAEFNRLYIELDKEAEAMANEFYSPEIAALNTDTKNEIAAAYRSLPEEFEEIGRQSMESLLNGLALNENADLTGLLTSGITGLKDGVNAALNSMISDYSFADFLSPSGSGNSSGIMGLLGLGDLYDMGKNAAQSFSSGFNDNISLNSAVFSTEQSYSGNISSASLNESNLAATAQKIIDAIKNIQIKNTVNTALKVDGRVIAKSVSESDDILERISDTW